MFLDCVSEVLGTVCLLLSQACWLSLVTVDSSLFSIIRLL